MAHFAKYGAGATGHMLSHYDRSKENISGNIDWNRTSLNYNLAPARTGGQVAFMRERLSQVKVQKRKDLNVLCSWIVTLPKKFVEENGVNKEVKYSDEEVGEFFKENYKFLAEKYGEENVVSAYVHMDESQPHMHFAFLPVVEDRKWNKKHPEAPRQKLSAKECVTQYDLKTFHTELQERMDARFGIDTFPVLNGATLEGNLTVTELKAVRATNEICDNMVVLQNEKLELQLEVEKTAEKLSEVQGEISSLKAEKTSLEEEIEPYKEMKASKDEVEDMTTRTRTILPGIALVKKKELEQTVEMAKAYAVNSEDFLDLQYMRDVVRTQKVELEQKSKLLDKRVDEVNRMYEEQKDLNKVVQQVRSENWELKQELKKQKQQVSSLSAENISLMGQIGDLKTESAEKVSRLSQQIESLKNRLRNAYEVLTTAVKAVGMFKYSKSGDYGMEHLNPKQDRLIDGIAEYGMKQAREEGFTDLADEMDTQVGIDSDLREFAQVKTNEKNRGQNYYSGPER